MALVSKWLVLDGIIDFSEMTARLRSRRRLYDLFWRRAACKEKRRGRKPSRAGRKRTDGGEEGRTGKREEERTRERGRVRRKWLVVTHARFFRRTAFLKIFPPVAACRFKSPGRSIPSILECPEPPACLLPALRYDRRHPLQSTRIFFVPFLNSLIKIRIVDSGTSRRIHPLYA